jgi:hypothetical protein
MKWIAWFVAATACSTPPRSAPVATTTTSAAGEKPREPARAPGEPAATPTGTAPLIAKMSWELIWSPSRKTVWVPEKTRICSFAPDATGAALATFSCTALPAGADVQLLGVAADGAPLPVVTKGADRSDEVRLLGSPAIITRGSVQGAFAWSADAVDVLLGAPSGFTLERHRGATVTRTTVPVKEGSGLSWRLGAGVIYYTEPVSETGERTRVHALVFGRDRDPDVKAIADLGIAAKWVDGLVRCDSARRHAILLVDRLAIAVDGKWGKSVPLPSDPDLVPDVSCDDASVTALAYVDHQHAVARVRCTAAGCARETARFPPSAPLEHADMFGDRLLGTYTTDAGEVRLHVATPAAWGRGYATDPVITRAKDARTQDLVGDDAAIVLVIVGDQVTAYRVAASGAVDPEPVR